MKVRRLLIFVMSLITVLTGSCIGKSADASGTAEMPNPASVYCEQNGGTLELRQDAQGGVQGVCLFPDGSECEEWAYFRGECAPVSESREDHPADQSDPSPVPLADDASILSADDYHGWWTYDNSDYGFSIKLPEDWAVEETSTFDPMMNGHFLMLHPRVETGSDLNIRMSFRRKGEDTLLWPTGVGAGEFVPDGTLEVSGQLIRRLLFRCPSGVIGDIWYHGLEETSPNIQIGEMEFGFITSYTGVYCQEGFSLDSKLARLSDMIVASLELQ